MAPPRDMGQAREAAHEELLMTNDRLIACLQEMRDRDGLRDDDFETIDQVIEALYRCDVANSAVEPSCNCSMGSMEYQHHALTCPVFVASVSLRHEAGCAIFSATGNPACSCGALTRSPPPAGLANLLKTPTANDCFEAVNAMIKTGDLGGNGLDKNAERNGLILAANAIAALIHPPHENSKVHVMSAFHCDFGCDVPAHKPGCPFYKGAPNRPGES